MLGKYKNILIYTACILLILTHILYLPSQKYIVFESPDENANFLTTKIYTETGNFWYIEDYTSLDDENYLHPRHFITHEGKIVPTQFWGLPVTYGPLYGIAREYTGLIFAIVFSLLSFTFFIKLVTLLFGNNSGIFAAIIFTVNIPLLYYLSVPFFNATGAITFFIIGLFYLARFSRLTNNKDIFLSALFFSISIFFRFDYALFIAIVITIVILIKYRTNIRAYLKPLIIFVIVIFLFTVIPVMLLNHQAYGDFHTFGYKLLELYSIEREATTWAQFLLPNPIIPDIIIGNISRLIFIFIPIVSLLAILGLIHYIKEGKCNKYKFLFGLLFIYLLFYSGSSDTWNAYNLNYLGLNISIIRYWLICYVLLTIIAVKGLIFIGARYEKTLILLIFILLLTSIGTFFTNTERSMVKLSAMGYVNQEVALKVKVIVDDKSIIYSDSYD